MLWSSCYQVNDTSDNLRLSGKHSTNASYLPASTAATTNTCLRYGWHFELGSTPLRMQNSDKAKSEFRVLGDPGDSDLTEFAVPEPGGGAFVVG